MQRFRLFWGINHILLDLVFLFIIDPLRNRLYLFESNRDDDILFDFFFCSGLLNKLDWLIFQFLGFNL